MDSFYISVFIVFSVSLHTSNSRENVQNNKELQLVSGIHRFSSAFFLETSMENEKQSLVMSPLSAEVSLALLSLGAKGETLETILTVLGVPDTDFIKETYRSMIRKLNKMKGVTLKMANKVYVDILFPLDKEFQKFAFKYFRAEAENIDFVDPPNGAVKSINSWLLEYEQVLKLVNNTTEGTSRSKFTFLSKEHIDFEVDRKTNYKIKNIVQPDVLTNAQIILVNAVYFKGTWQQQFDRNATVNSHFFINHNTTIQVPMMKTTGIFNYGDSSKLKAEILELPYVRNDISMFIILPYETNGLEDLQHLLIGKTDVHEILLNLKKREVEVSIPKFKIETSIDAKIIIERLGLHHIFDNDAELEGILENRDYNGPLYVSGAIQKTIIEINEEGAEAATATSTLLLAKNDLRKEYISADHPFVFILMTKNGIPLFYGSFYG